MKRWIHSATEVSTYKNKRNSNKRLEVHRDGYGHQSARQYMEWEDAGVKNPVGDGNLHRWRKGNMDELLEDYEEVESADNVEPEHVYIVRLFYEVDPGRDAVAPVAAQRIFEVAADSEEEAIAEVENEWADFGLGLADKIEVIAVDPEETDSYFDEPLPFEASTEVKASQSTRDRISELEEKIEILEERIARGQDPEETIDDQILLQELKEQLNFAWQDDEAEYMAAWNAQEFNPDGSLKGYDDYYDDINASTLVDNKKIQKGLVWYRDGFRSEVVDVSKDGKKCKIVETWINEDTGKPMKVEEVCNISTDEEGREFAWQDKYKEYAFNESEPDGYRWWARSYAVGAENYPHNLDKEENGGSKSNYTLEEAINLCKKEAEEDGDYYSRVRIYVNSKLIYDGNSLDGAWRSCNYYGNELVDKFSWHDADIVFYISEEDDEYDDEYTPSATRGDYSPSNPWDAPGMSMSDFF